MALFGSFETEREVYSDPIYTVYSAKRAGEPNADYAVKVFSIQQVGFDPDEALDLAPLLVDIESSRSQCIEAQALAAASSKFIAPVLEKGQDERGVWYATHFYPRSVNKIIVGKVALSREAVLHLMRSVAQGALDFKRACGRSHGDILPSNIQISRSEKLSEAGAVLCDPMPGGPEEAVTFEVNDLRNIGRILLQLVQQRAINNEDDFLILPILSSPQWLELFGKDSPAWLGLCNRLLDPNLSLDQMTLEQLVSELDALQPKSGISPKILLAAAGGFVLLVALVAFLLHPRPQEVTIISDPAGATILVDKKEQAQVAPLKLRLKKSTYEIEARHPSLGSRTTNLVVATGGSQELQFRFAYGSLILKSEPAGADVELEGKKIGATPFTSGPLPPGERSYTLRLPNYEQFKLSVTISSNGQAVSPPIARLNARKAGDVDVEITSIPSGARIEEGGQVFGGETPIVKPLSPTVHQLTAHFPGWPEFTISTQFVAKANLAVALEFPFATVSFDDISPADGSVSLNGKLLGIVRDLPPKRLPPGEYSVAVTNAGFYPAEQKLTLRKDAREPVRIKLKPMEGVVEFSSDPPGATIFDARDLGKPLGKTLSGKMLPVSLKPDKYSFVAVYTNLDEVRTPLLSVDLGKTLQQPLQFAYGTVEFDSLPTPADLIIAGAVTNRTPFNFRPKPGPITYRLEAPDYYPEQGTTSVVAGKSILIAAKLRPRDVSVLLQSEPPGAEFYIGQNKLAGTNDLFSLPWGNYSIIAHFAATAGLPELEPVTQNVEVDKNGKTKSRFEFKYATLDITNAEPDIQLSYQGRSLTIQLPAHLVLKPDLPGDIVIESGDFKTNLSARLAPGARSRQGVILPELRRLYTNTVNMVLVRVNQDLYVGQFEVTEQQYRAVKKEPLQDKPLAPAVNLTWDDARKYCDALTALDKISLERQKLAGWTYSLPTGAEWKLYAEPTPEVLKNSLLLGRPEALPAEIDYQRKSAGRLGIYDTFGNAAEWGLNEARQPITTGGNATSRRPQPARAFELNQDNPPPDTLKTGSPLIGFRCILRRTTP